MASVTGFTAERMLEIENSTIVDGVITQDNLVLKRRDGGVIDAGNVRGLPGLKGEKGDPGVSPSLSDAVLDNQYNGIGAARVRINGTLTPTRLEWLTPYKPNASRRVKLQTFGTSQFIVGQVSEAQTSLTLGSVWQPYGLLSNDNSFNGRPKAYRLSSGLVVLSGLLRSLTVGVDGQLIGTLPAGFRPSQNLIIGTIQGDAARSIQIHKTGQITARGVWGMAQYLSLDGITFFADGSVTWTPIGMGGVTFGAPFVAHPDPFWGTPSYYKDPYGFLWFQGLVNMNASVTTDNTTIVNLPSTMRSHLAQHHYTGGSDTKCILGCDPIRGLTWKTGAPTVAGSWITLTNVSVVTEDAANNNAWIPMYPGGGWSQFNAEHTAPAIFRRDDGLCVTMGLLKGGGIGTRAMSIPQEFWPEGGRLILPAVSVGQLSRVDIGSAYEFDMSIQPGGLVPRMGDNSWFAIDGIKWVP